MILKASKVTFPDISSIRCVQDLPKKEHERKRLALANTRTLIHEQKMERRGERRPHRAGYEGTHRQTYIHLHPKSKDSVFILNILFKKGRQRLLTWSCTIFFLFLVSDLHVLTFPFILCVLKLLLLSHLSYFFFHLITFYEWFRLVSFPILPCCLVFARLQCKKLFQDNGYFFFYLSISFHQTFLEI